MKKDYLIYISIYPDLQWDEYYSTLFVKFIREIEKNIPSKRESNYHPSSSFLKGVTLRSPFHLIPSIIVNLLVPSTNDNFNQCYYIKILFILLILKKN